MLVALLPGFILLGVGEAYLPRREGQLKGVTRPRNPGELEIQPELPVYETDPLNMAKVALAACVDRAWCRVHFGEAV